MINYQEFCRVDNLFLSRILRVWPYTNFSFITNMQKKIFSFLVLHASSKVRLYNPVESLLFKKL